MTQFYDSLKELISHDMVAKAAHTLEEKDSHISEAMSTILASFLGVMMKKGKTPQIRNIVERAGNLNILSNLDNICAEKPTQEQQEIGDDFLQHLLGDKAADFTDPIAEQSGISPVATNRLVSILAPVVVGFFGEKMVKDKIGWTQIEEEIKKQKHTFAEDIPSRLVTLFGLKHLLAETTPPPSVKDNSLGGVPWLKWLLLLLLLIALFFWWRSCDASEPAPQAVEETVVEPVAPEDVTVTVVEPTIKELTLPNGVKLQAYAGGIEDKMIAFLQSDEYKNATNEDLSNKWFEFDNIDFEFNSPTELMVNSQVQLDNVIAILNYFKEAKVIVAGKADKVGTENVNMEISQQRAKTIETMLDKGGIGAQIVKTVGFGETYATRNESASDQERAKDRDIALRFTK